MGSVIEINVKEVGELAKKLAAYSLTPAQEQSLLKSLGAEIAEQTLDRFDNERDPDGGKWKPLTERYAKTKREGTRKKGAKNKTGGSKGGILVREGFMSKIHMNLSGASVLVGSAEEYADYHQNAKKANRRRKFLGLNSGNIADLSDAIDTFMGKQTNG
jgi:phage virion morphogenesis protein